MKTAQAQPFATHKKVAISLTDDGKFTAVIGGRDVSAPSLDAMKKRIDKAGDAVFEPFKVLRIDSDGWGGEEKFFVAEYTVTGISFNGRRSKYSDQRMGYRLVGTQDQMGRVDHAVIEATPANRKALERLCAYRNETKKIDRMRAKEVGRQDGAIPRRKITDEKI